MNFKLHVGKTSREDNQMVTDAAMAARERGHVIEIIDDRCYHHPLLEQGKLVTAVGPKEVAQELNRI